MTNCHRKYFDLRLRGKYSLFKIIFGGILANKSITTRSFTLLSVTVMI